MITADDLKSYGFVVQAAFRSSFPDGLTLEQLREKSRDHGYLRKILRDIDQNQEGK